MKEMLEETSYIFENEIQTVRRKYYKISSFDYIITAAITFGIVIGSNVFGEMIGTVLTYPATSLGMLAGSVFGVARLSRLISLEIANRKEEIEIYPAKKNTDVIVLEREYSMKKEKAYNDNLKKLEILRNEKERLQASSSKENDKVLSLNSIKKNK